MRWLDRLAAVCGVFAAFFLGMIGVIIGAQIVMRFMGTQIPAADDFAAWSMAASVFLGLPYAMLHGDHIRVVLLLQALPKHWHKPYEIVATAIAVLLTAWGTWHVAVFAYESYIYNEVAQGMVRMPLWIPQVTMPIGMALFCLMLVRRLVRCIRGEQLEETQHG